MKISRILSLFLALCLSLSLCLLPVLAAPEAEEPEVPASEETSPDAAAPAQPSATGEDEPFEVAAKAAALIDLNNDRYIYALNTDVEVYPASLTKIMTCLLALENGNLSDIVTVSESAFNGLDGNSSSAGLQIGEQLTLENALYCLMLASGNESANVIAEHIAGSVNDFVRMMNERAYELGCTNTHFSNVHGLHDETHYTTVNDLILITKAALKSETFKIITNTAEYILPATNMSEERELVTTNQLINDSTSNAFYYSRAIGIKTGFTTPAGRCLISTAKHDGLYLLAVICGAETTVADSGDVRMESFPQAIRLFNWAFDNFSYVTIVSPLYPVTQIAVKNSAASEVVSLAPRDSIRLLLPTTYDPSLIKIEPDLPSQFTEAPVSSGDVFGTVTVSYDGEVLGTTDLLAINDVARSELSAAADQTSNYIQSNWWKWVVAVILLLILALLMLLLVVQIQRKREQERRMAARRRALEERKKRMREFDHFDDF